MPAKLQKFSDSNRRIDPNNERFIGRRHCDQTYLLAWDDKEWNSVKDWIHVAESPVRNSHPRHGKSTCPL